MRWTHTFSFIILALVALSQFGCGPETDLPHEHFIVVEIHGSQSQHVHVTAERRGDPEKLLIRSLAERLGPEDILTAFIPSPPGAYTVSVEITWNTYYYGSGTSRPLRSQADPVVVQSNQEAPRIALHFGEIDIDLHVSNPNRQPEDGISLELVTPVLRTPVARLGSSYFGPVDEIIDTWRDTVPPGRYRIRALTSNDQYSYLQSRSEFGLSDFVDVHTSGKTKYTVEIGPPGRLFFHIRAPGGEGQELRVNFHEADSGNPLLQPFKTFTQRLVGSEHVIEMEMWPATPFLIDGSLDSGINPLFSQVRWISSYERNEATSFDIHFSPDATAHIYYEASTLFLNLGMSRIGRSSVPLVSFLDLAGREVRRQAFRPGSADTLRSRTTNLIPGEYKLRVISTGGNVFPTQYYPSSADNFESAEILTFTAGESMSLQWTLRKGPSVRGRVTGLSDDERTIKFAYLTAVDSTLPRSRSFDINAEGEFEVTPIGSGGGRYKLAVRENAIVRYYPGTEDWESAHVIELSGLGIVDVGDFEFSR